MIKAKPIYPRVPSSRQNNKILNQSYQKHLQLNLLDSRLHSNSVENLQAKWRRIFLMNISKRSVTNQFQMLQVLWHLSRGQMLLVIVFVNDSMRMWTTIRDHLRAVNLSLDKTSKKKNNLKQVHSVSGVLLLVAV